MAICPYLNECPFFNDKMLEKPELTNMYKKTYCNGDFSTCARWMIANNLGKEYVPLTIYPNMLTQVESIINEIREKICKMEKKL